MGEKRNAYSILVGKPEGEGPLGRPRHRWVDNIKIDLTEIGWDKMDWIDLAQDRDCWRALVKLLLLGQRHIVSSLVGKQEESVKYMNP
jgi:hypothetical protein